MKTKWLYGRNALQHCETLRPKQIAPWWPIKYRETAKNGLYLDSFHSRGVCMGAVSEAILLPVALISADSSCSTSTVHHRSSNNACLTCYSFPCRQTDPLFSNYHFQLKSKESTVYLVLTSVDWFKKTATSFIIQRRSLWGEVIAMAVMVWWRIVLILSKVNCSPEYVVSWMPHWGD